MDPKFGGIIHASLTSGHDFTVSAMQEIGSDKVKAALGVFAKADSLRGSSVTGVFAEANVHGHGLSIQHYITHGVCQTLAENARINLMQSGAHTVDANAFHGRRHLNNGLNFDKVGGNMVWNHAQGHAASVGISHNSIFDMKTVEASATAILWSTASRDTTLDLTVNARRHLSGPFAGQNNFGGGLGFTHRI